ncbi:hypothetical protein [Tenacibaculum sp. E3R01]|uniref:hypothetical protein n=1 Tax=Tenacibaculum sp. E3R01 TaxID=2267227 RepID=UPI0011BEAB2F|nr:hypothetical protein [Tenacibaculum sp. E3R01]
MKNSIVYMLILLLFAPPMQAHNDVVIYDTLENHFDIDEAHEDIHHQEDSQDEENTEHHHHCNVVSLSSEFVPILEYNFQFLTFITIKQEINFYQNTYLNSFLEEIFQPPRV